MAMPGAFYLFGNAHFFLKNEVCAGESAVT